VVLTVMGFLAGSGGFQAASGQTPLASEDSPLIQVAAAGPAKKVSGSKRGTT
jgi:hypothetical protein